MFQDLYCCRQRMTVLDNGVELQVSEYAYKSADLYQCAQCGHQVHVVDSNSPASSSSSMASRLRVVE